MIKTVTEKKGAGSFARRDHLLNIEGAMQKTWEEKRVYDAESPAEYDPSDKHKYFCSFPYPYMNGRLHLGHAFTLTKSEFQARFQRLLGKQVLWPFAFHCTGMPIVAAANNLKRELAAAEESDKEEESSPEPTSSTDPSQDLLKIGKFSGKKTKAAQKSGGLTQYEILLRLGIPEEEIPLFADPAYWLTYFSPHGMEDLKKFGVSVDWRRSFITTDANPYYDSFIRWQFTRLRERQYVAFGTRPTVFSPIDKQPCADHDRAQGEGVKEQEYTLVKLQLQSLDRLPSHVIEQINQRPTYLVAATLRPETMYGQTNCYVLPEGDYSIVESVHNNELYITALRAARNMGWQNNVRMEVPASPVLDVDGQGVPEPVVVATVKGQDLIGSPVSAPLSSYPTVYVLPMFGVSMDKGTGVVTSVPSDSPDDFAALRDLQQKEPLRAKYNITQEMVEFPIIEIIDIPGLGSRAAEKIVNDKKIKSQNDKVALAEAKQEVYMKGFYEGIMLVGSQKGKKVCDAKQSVRDELLLQKHAMMYWEPESKVMSRSGAECVIAEVDQWFLNYGEEKWRTRVENHVNDSSLFNAYNPTALHQYQHVLSWLGKWGCSRQFGLGTRLPWDESVLIESLSDSTIYMAFYTIAHQLLGEGNIDGQKKGPIALSVEDLSLEAWDYIFAQPGSEASLSSFSPEVAEKLKTLRKEFLFWYPLDLRVSGKDLIGNHLTMALYNHAAIWEEEDLMPTSYYTNGHILVDSEKMSKSKGNFLTVTDCIDTFSADVTRLVCADAGDTLEDANYSRDAANALVMRLYNFEEFARQIMGENPSEISSWRSESSPLTEADLMFENELARLVTLAKQGYEKLIYRDATRYSFYDVQTLRDQYRIHTDGEMHMGSVKKWLETQVLLLSPICPHLCDHIWMNVMGRKQSITKEGRWPVVAEFDNVLSRKYSTLQKIISDLRNAKDKASGGNRKKAAKGVAVTAPEKEMSRGVIYVATEFSPLQKEALMALQRVKWEDSRVVPTDLMKQLKDDEKLKTTFTSQEFQKILQYASFQAKDVVIFGKSALDLTLPFDELELLKTHQKFVEKSLAMTEMTFLPATGEAHAEDTVPEKRVNALPTAPVLSLF